MSIKREEIDRRNVDFSEVRSGRRLPLIHPGEILRDDFLTPMGISVYELAHAIKVPRSRANDIVRGRRAITTDTAIRLGRYFGMTAEFWINLQARYDLDVADRTLRRRIEQEVKPRAARPIRQQLQSAAVTRLSASLVGRIGADPVRRSSASEGGRRNPPSRRNVRRHRASAISRKRQPHCTAYAPAALASAAFAQRYPLRADILNARSTISPHPL